MIKTKHISTVMFAVCLFLAGCGQDSSTVDNTPPSAPVIVQRSADDIYPQRGIRPEASTSDQNYWVRLEWNKNPEPDLYGYRIWRTAEADTSLTGALWGWYIVADLSINSLFNSDILYYVDHGLGQGGRDLNLLAPLNNNTRGYFWEIEAYDEAGNRSAHSQRQYYRLLNNPSQLSVENLTSNQFTISFSYELPTDVYPTYCVFRVFNEQFGPDSIVWFGSEHVYGTINTIYFNRSDAIRPFVPGVTYRWQVNVVADQPTEAHVSGLAGSAIYKSFEFQN